MNDFEDLDQYNGDPQHDMWVDYDFNENTGVLSDIFDEDSLDSFIDNLNE